jgi:hypothetical protein
VDSVSKSNPEMAYTSEINVAEKYLVVYRNMRLTFKVRAPTVGISGRTIQNVI